MLFLAAWTILVARRVPSPGGDAEARRRVECALAYAREIQRFSQDGLNEALGPLSSTPIFYPVGSKHRGPRV
jgi:hypothetical protein